MSYSLHCGSYVLFLLTADTVRSSIKAESNLSLLVLGTDLTKRCVCVFAPARVCRWPWSQNWALEPGSCDRTTRVLTTEPSLQSYTVIFMCWIVAYKVSIYPVNTSNRTEQQQPPPTPACDLFAIT